MPSIKTPAEMRELLSKTTQGKWTVFSEGRTLEVDRNGSCRASILHWSGFDACSRPLGEQRHNARFIAAAHNSMSHYLDRIEEMEKALRAIYGLTSIPSSYLMGKQIRDIIDATLPSPQ